VVVARSARALDGGWLGRNSLAPHGEALGARSAPPRAGKPPHIWAWRPPVERPRMPRRARRPKPRPARVTVEEQATDRWAKGGRGCRRTRRLHAGVRTPRVASVRATPGERAALGWRAARKLRRVRRKRDVGAAHERPIHFTVPWFRRV
jgi:hypothetical protein